MRGNYRKKSRPQAQQAQRLKQTRFGGALNQDTPPSKIADDEFAILENFVAHPDYLEGRSGSQKFSDTALPGSGNFLGFNQHPRSGHFFLARGNKAYSCTSAMSTWNEMKPRGVLARSVTFNHDNDQLSGEVLYVHKDSLGGVDTLFWTLTNSGTTRTVSIYLVSSPQDATTLIAQGSRDGDGLVILTQKYTSSQAYWSLIGGYVTVAYTGDDTGVSNTITPIFPDANLTTNALYTKSVPYSNPLLPSEVNSGFICFRDSSIIYADPNQNVYAKINESAANGGYPPIPLAGSGTQGAGTPYGRRYIVTFSTIQQSNGGISGLIGAASYPNRLTAAHSLIFESASNEGSSGIDYGEHWFAAAVSGAAPVTVDLLRSTSPLVPIGYSSAPHFTHVSIYGTLDIGDNGVDPVTGAGNNREIYVWIADVDYTATSYSDSTTDAVLRARLLAGLTLKTRFWKPLPGAYVEDGKSSGLTGDVAEGFLFSGFRGGSEVPYSQLNKPELMGYYNPAFQVLRPGSAIMELHACGDALVILCEDKTFASYPKIIASVSLLEAVFVIKSLNNVSESIGVVDHGSIASIDKDSFIAHCSDHTVRVFAQGGWGREDLAHKINSAVIKKIPSSTFLSASGYTGSTAVFFDGVYYLWYQIAGPDQANSATAYNSQCLRFAFGGEAGHGISRITGSAWVNPPPIAGALAVKDAKKIRRILVIDYTDAAIYWIETFDGFTNSGLTKYYRDKVAVAGTGGTAIAPKLRLREITGEEESHTVYHEETHIYLRPSASSYESGFAVDLLAYVNGAAAATEEVTNIPQAGDIQFWKKIEGRRIQLEAEFSTSGLIIAGVDTHYQSHDTATIGAGPVDTDEATYQAALSGAATLKHWLTRPRNLFNRATGTNYTATGTAVTNTTGPDGKSYGLLFGDSQYVQADITAYSDFTIMFWIRNLIRDTSEPNYKLVVTLDGATDLEVKWTFDTTLSIGGQEITTADVSASTWRHYALVRSGNTITVYQNGVSLGTVTLATARGGTQVVIGSTDENDQQMEIFDLRIYNDDISAAAITYYNAKVSTTEEGTKVLPIV